MIFFDVLFIVFIMLALVVCYLFLIVYSWIYLGEPIRLQISLLDINVVVVPVFSNLQLIMVVYIVLGIFSMVIWGIGSQLLSSGVLCANTAPVLYAYSTFLVVTYWLGFTIVMIFTIKLFYGDFIAAIVKDQIRAPTMAELEDRIFRKSFAEFDVEKEGKISRDDAGKLLQKLGVYVPDNELPALMISFDPNDTGEVKFDVMYAWFKQLNAAADTADKKEREKDKEDD